MAADAGATATRMAARAADGRDRVWVRRARLLMWAGLAIAMISMPFLALPGRYVNDTRDALWLAPGSYLAHAFQLWHSSPYLGFEQHDGIVFPMAAVVWVLRSIGLSAWTAERVWHGMLLFAAAAFTILLVDRLRGWRSVTAPLVAGLIYALTPFAFGYGIPFTGTFLAYVTLPLLVLIVLIGSRNPGVKWPAAFGLATFLMGGGNGAPQVYALIVCGLLLLWLALFDRRVRARDVLAFGVPAFAFFVGLNAYWLLLLRSGEIANALRYSEAPKVINVDSSVAESVRGLGLWLFYGGDGAGPWVPSVRAFIAVPALVVTTFAVPVAAFAAAWRTRWRLRLFFVLLAILSVFVVSGIFPVTSPTPFGALLSWAYTHVPGVGGLRTTYKFAAAIELSLAVLVGMGVDPALAALRRARRPSLVTAAAVAATFVVIVANGFPLWSGNLYPTRASTPAIPAYWHEALADLGRLDGHSRTFFAPAIEKATYRWGSLKEGITAAAPDLPTIVPIRLPVGERYGSNLLRAVEQPYFEGTNAAGTATLLRYLGVSNVVLQNDLDWRASRTARPFATQALARAPDIDVARTYGASGENVPPPLGGTIDPLAKLERTLHPVEVLEVRDPRQIVRAEGSPPAVVSGDGFGLAAAAAAGLLKGGPPVLYSGTMTPEQVTLAEDAGARFVITDSNRRRVWSFTTPRGHASATLPVGGGPGLQRPGYGLFGDRTSTQTVAVYPGLRSIRASTDASPAGSVPQFRPALGFDGDPATWWLADPTGDGVGSWIEADLAHPVTISSLTITTPPSSQARSIRQVRIGLSTGTRLTVAVEAGQPTTVRFPATRIDRVRVTIERVAPSPTGRPTAIADIGIPGLDPAEILRTPVDLLGAARATRGGLDALARAPLTYLFERSRTATAADHDEETTIARRFEVPGAASFAMAGTARLDPGASDQAIDRLLYGPLPVVVTSSSRRLGNPGVRGSAAFDADPTTAWVPDGTVGQWLSVRFPPRRIGSIEVLTDLRPGRLPITGLRAELSDGTTVTGRPLSETGVIRFTFAPRLVTSVRLTVSSVYASGSSPGLPVAIRDVRIPGVSIRRLPASTPLACTADAATLDGSPLSVLARGTIGDALAGRNLAFRTCHSSRLGLRGGVHDLRVGGVLQPTVVTLSSPGEARPAISAPSPPPRLTWSSTRDGRYRIRVTDAAGPFFLVIGQNDSPSWQASIAGADLGSPILLDGYSAGWYVTRAGTYTIDVRYGPQRLYAVALAVSAFSLLIAIVVVLVTAIVGHRRRRRMVAP